MKILLFLYFIISISCELITFPDNTVISIQDPSNSKYLIECGSDCMSCSTTRLLCFKGNQANNKAKYTTKIHSCNNGPCMSLKNVDTNLWVGRYLCNSKAWMSDHLTIDNSPNGWWYFNSQGNNLYQITNGWTNQYLNNGGNVANCNNVAALTSTAYNVTVIVH